MKLQTAIFLLLGACLQVTFAQDKNATLTIASSTDHVKPGEEFNITCEIENYDLLDSDSYILGLYVNYRRTQPVNSYLAPIGDFRVTSGNQSVWWGYTSEDLEVVYRNAEFATTKATFQVTINPLTYNANGYYQCRVRNYTTGENLLEPSQAWESAFDLQASANPTIPTVEVSISVQKVADSKDLLLAKCVTNVMPKYTNYQVFFVSDYRKEYTQVIFGDYSVNFDTKTITWTSDNATDELNFYPQNNTDFFPIFNALIQTKKSEDYIRGKLMCFVQLSGGQLFLSTSASFAVAPSMLALVLFALVKLFN